MGYSRIVLERTVTAQTEEEDSDIFVSCTDMQQERQRELPSHYTVRLPTRRRPESLPLTWRLRLEREKQLQVQELQEHQLQE